MNQEHLMSLYFENKLSTEEEIIFQNYLDTDVTFADEFAYQKNVRTAISLNERAKLKRILQSFELPKSRKNWISKWSVAASIAIVLGSCFWFFNQNPNSQDLFDQYYQTYPNTVLPAVRGESSDNIKAKAFEYYDAENFNKSYELFLNIYSAEKQDYALFYSGISLMELAKYEDALLLFDQFDFTKNSSFAPFVKWFKALCYLKLKQNDKAIEVLKELSQTANPQQKQALELLKKLE